MTRRFRTLLFCACATLPTLPVQAQAQDRAQDRASVTQDIIVTARRTEERLQDVPISITVFNQEELANRNVVNAQDLAAYTPSLSANGNFGSENSSFAIRGFAQDIGTAPSVGVISPMWSRRAAPPTACPRAMAPGRVPFSTCRMSRY
ncbi:Outer membrane receptor protein precursor [Sphingobium yanoikuyae]|uniref:Outer membrane receptor protein n=1 Tax=Sphingobium yanoikuyae TaxID=13690 RepID=A0A084EHJ4_SPHYA|nr:TonB-dependent receptor plug domain-containing protein [Sphingobium yanoikuyae]KEZ17436.1 Outer membrane receptor protein precursor [Sphingobium yanoikuyae]